MSASLEKIKNIIEKYHQVKQIIIIGGGTSIKQFDLSQLQVTNHQLIICCNQAFHLIPTAHISHHSDYAWWLQYQDQLQQDFQGELITGCGLGHNKAYPEIVTQLRCARVDSLADLFTQPDLIYGNNCGLQALALAHLFQPTSIYLLGFDFNADADRTHGYAKTDSKELAHYEKFWGLFLKDFRRFEAHRKSLWSKAHPDRALPQIYNLNPQSALTLYPPPTELPAALKQVKINPVETGFILEVNDSD